MNIIIKNEINWINFLLTIKFIYYWNKYKILDYNSFKIIYNYKFILKFNIENDFIEKKNLL